MKPSLLTPITALLFATGAFSASSMAGEETVPLERFEREERYEYRESVPEYRPQPRKVYIIIRERPVQHIVYGAPGGYYRYEGGRRLIVREPCYTSLPSRYRMGHYHRRIGARICY